MTSMLLTDSASRCAASALADIEAIATIGRLHFLAAIARRDLLLGRVLHRALLDHLAHERAVAGHERRELMEARAVPLLELDHARALVVAAARLDRREQAGRAELLQPRVGEVQVLESPAHLLGGHHLALAVLVLRQIGR